MDAKPRCKATTIRDEPCKSPSVQANGFCVAHQPQEVKDSIGFGGAQPGSGRPRRPREIELYQEVATEFQEEIRQALRDGLTAKRSVVVGNGPDAHTEEVEDIPTRLKTVDMIADRLHGKPRQATEISGPEGHPLTTNIISDPEIAEAARAVLRRAAPSSDG